MKLLPVYFIISMLITMFILYILYPEPEVMVKYPSLTEKLSDVYVDDNNVCYRYKRNEIDISSKSANKINYKQQEISNIKY